MVAVRVARGARCVVVRHYNVELCALLTRREICRVAHGYAYRDRVLDEIHAPAAHPASGVMRDLIEIEAPGAIRIGVQVDAASGSSEPAGVEREIPAGCRLLNAGW